MPLTGQRLMIEPTYPLADKLMKIGREDEAHEADPKVKIRNKFWSKRLRAEVFVYEDNGKIGCVTAPKFHSLSFLLNTLGCQQAWGIEQEGAAVKLLGELVSHHQFKQYMLTGMFLERSTRSHLTYMFRRLRPTVVIDAKNETSDESARVIAALCMHPIAYYEGTWAGAMCPTDDVIAHLMLMRGDEHMFWRRCNQHAPDRPEAGI